MEFDPDFLLTDGDNRDWLREKALHIRLDETTINGHVQEAERSVRIRYLGSRRAVGPTCQSHASAITSPRASVGGRQRHGANYRRARTDPCYGRHRSKRG
jgi:hypothetical protein